MAARACGGQGGHVVDRVRVELVDEAGVGVGECGVAEAHTPPGRLHRAFSVQLFDSRGHALVHRRATTKSRFAGRWTNTCCSHPAPGEDLVESAIARVREELGLTVGTLTEVGRFTYRAADPASGTVEHEYDHVLVGTCDDDPDPDPAEIAEWSRVDPAQLVERVRREPEQHSPWFGGVLRHALR